MVAAVLLVEEAGASDAMVSLFAVAAVVVDADWVVVAIGWMTATSVGADSTMDRVEEGDSVDSVLEDPWTKAAGIVSMTPTVGTASSVVEGVAALDVVEVFETVKVDSEDSE